MTLREHLRTLARAAVTLSLALASIAAGITLAASGMEIGVDLEFERWDAIWILLLLPVLALVVTILLSPLSLLFDRLLFRSARSSTENEPRQG